VATIGEDYAAVRDLMGDLLATASEIKMRETIEDTIAAVRFVAARRPDPDIDGATVRQVANELDLDRSAVHRRLKAAESEGHIVNLENRKGYPVRYKPTADGGGGLLRELQMTLSGSAKVSSRWPIFDAQCRKLEKK
jgi:DNA-binding MarR family transcriptional regulator